MPHGMVDGGIGDTKIERDQATAGRGHLFEQSSIREVGVQMDIEPGGE